MYIYIWIHGRQAFFWLIFFCVYVCAKKESIYIIYNATICYEFNILTLLIGNLHLYKNKLDKLQITSLTGSNVFFQFYVFNSVKHF